MNDERTVSGGCHYHLEVRVDPESQGLTVEATIDHPPTTRFYLHREFAVESVRAGGRELPFRQLPAEPLPYAPYSAPIEVDAGEVEQLQISYRGKLAEPVSGINMINADLVELAYYATWYPVFQNVIGGYTFEMDVELPAAFQSTTNGLLQARREEGGRTRSRWRSYGPVGDVVLVASPHLSYAQSEADMLRIEMYSYRLPAEAMDALLAGMIDGVARLSDWYGAPRVPGLLRFVYSPRHGWDYSRAPLFIVSEDRAREQLAAPGGEPRVFHSNCHEMAHFWWAIADTSTPDDWINEGLAEFSAFRLSRERYGEERAAQLLETYRSHARQSATETPIAETETESPDRQVNRYEKTTLMFLAAQQRFGQAPLDQLCARLFARFGTTGGATTNRFLEEAEACMGQAAAAFFREHLWAAPFRVDEFD
jgi:hypothetical protein